MIQCCTMSGRTWHGEAWGNCRIMTIQCDSCDPNLEDPCLAEIPRKMFFKMLGFHP